MFNQLKFYADTAVELNKRFTWSVKNKQGAHQAIARFEQKGWKIRAAWYNHERLV